MQRTDGFSQLVIEPLERVGRTLRRYVAVEGLCRCLAVLVLAAGLQLMTDRLLVLEAGPRAAMLMVLLFIVARQFHRRVIRPAAVRPNANDIAAILERKHPDYADRLISAVAFATGGGTNPHRDSPALVRALLDQSATQFRSLPTKDVLRHGRYARYLVLGLAAMGATATAFIAAPDTMATYVDRNWLLGDVPWPTSTRIVPEGFRKGRLRWPVGDDLTLVATALDEPPRALQAEFRLPSGNQTTRKMDRRGRDQFILDYGPLTQAMRVRFLIWRLGVDEYTPWYDVDAVHRPSVRTLRVEVSPPAYSGQPSYVLAQGQSGADVIRGSAVRIDAEMSKPVTTAALRARSDVRLAAEAIIEGGTHVSANFVPDRNGTYFFDVADESGLEDRAPVTCTFKLLADAAPKVRFTLPGTREWVVPNAVLNLSVDCEDNLGLQSVELRHEARRMANAASDAAPAWLAEPLPDLTSKQLRYTLRREWPLLPLTLEPGDQLALVVHATDYQPPVEIEAKADPAAKVAANLGESLVYTLRVVTPEELLTELGRREHEWRREFEQIIKAQEQINRRTMDLRDSRKDPALARQMAGRYAQETRTQRKQAGRIKTVTRQFEQILAELKVNQLAGPAVRRRLSGGVIAPLRQLAGTNVVETAEMMARLCLGFNEQLADEVEQSQAQIVRMMYDILADMLKWEGYNEAVALLRDVVRLQRDLNSDTQARLEREIDKLFGTEPSADDGSPPPEEDDPMSAGDEDSASTDDDNSPSTDDDDSAPPEDPEVQP